MELQKVLQKIIDWTVELNFGPGVPAPLIQFDVDRKASFEQVMQAIDRKIPVSKSALYSQYALPEPLDEDDAFIREDSGMMLSDSDKKKKLSILLSDSSYLRKEKEHIAELEDKLKFRAFTVAKLGTIKSIETVKEQLIATIADGKDYAEFWNRIKQTVEDDPTKIKPGYWETVFRTITQSAYMAGKLEQFQNDKSVVAYQLLVIEDSRTTQIGRNLLKKSTSYGMILPKSHSFWKTYGFAPYHMNCRTSIRAVFKSQVGKPGNIVENPTMKSLKSFKPQKGFGGNPLDTGNWWKLTESQIEQAIEYGIQGQFNREDNIFAVYDDVWDGYKRKSCNSGGWYDLCNNPPDDWFTDNKSIVGFLAENGFHIKVIPAIQNAEKKYGVKWSNPDILLNGKLADI